MGEDGEAKVAQLHDARGRVHDVQLIPQLQRGRGTDPQPGQYARPLNGGRLPGRRRGLNLGDGAGNIVLVGSTSPFSRAPVGAGFFRSTSQPSRSAADCPLFQERFNVLGAVPDQPPDLDEP